ncbi:MAG: YsnF/AvaK domain-containing protein [Solirubrobacterales bacterium]
MAYQFLVTLQKAIAGFLSDAKTQLSDRGNPKLLLKQEQLQIAKKRIQTGDVTIRKEVSVEDKTVTVPLQREDLVIEKRIMRPENPGQIETETIRIPIREERAAVLKHPVQLENVSVYRQRHQAMKQVDAVVRKETVRVRINGPKPKDRNH